MASFQDLDAQNASNAVANGGQVGSLRGAPAASGIDSARHILENYLRRRTIWNASTSTTRVSIFDLPDQILQALVPVPVTQQAAASAATAVPTKVTSATSAEGLTGLTCRCCGLVFSDVSEQKDHFKSDQHLRLLKRSLTSTSASTGESAAFDRDDDDGESGSGSESECPTISANSTNQDDEYLTAESSARRIAVPEGAIEQSYTKHYGAQYVMSAGPHHPWQFCVSTAVLALKGDGDAPEEPWQQVYNTLKSYRDQKIWAVFILRSGKFAGALFDGNSVVVHKIFRRYTVRAKAGGSQSSHDNKGGKAKSAGAMMRRAGEMALKDDIKQLVRDWGAYLETCSLILVSVPKVMRSVLFEDNTVASTIKDYPLRRDDPRVRSIPFMIDVPTFENAKKVHSICSTVVFTSVDVKAKVAVESELLTSAAILEEASSPLERMLEEVSLEALSPALYDSNNGNDSNSAKEEEKEAEQMAQMIANDESLKELIAGCRNGNRAAVRAVIRKHSHSQNLESPHSAANDSDDSDNDNSDNDNDGKGVQELPSELANNGMRPLSTFIDLPESIDAWQTALHIASESGFPVIVSCLLKAGANPGIKDVRGRVPYQLARDKDTRDAFRRFRGSSVKAEGLWDWDGACGVGAAITEDVERAKRDKEKEKKKRAKARKKEVKEREDQLVAEQARAARELEENKAKRLAEAQASAGQCASCGKALFGVKALDVFDRRCCSSECVLKLRRRLAAEAAEKRFAK